MTELTKNLARVKLLFNHLSLMYIKLHLMLVCVTKRINSIILSPHVDMTSQSIE